MTDETFDFKVEDGFIHIKRRGEDWERPCLRECLMAIYIYLEAYRHLKPSVLLDLLGINDPRAWRYDEDPIMQKAMDGKYPDLGE